MKLIIRGGRIIDPSSKLDRIGDIAIEDGKITSVGEKIGDQGFAKVISASGKVVAPGLIDMHTHLREPGREDEESISSGTRAAASGGFTGVVCMANTSPPVDTAASVEFIRSRAKEEGVVRVYPVGAVTKGIKGKELSEIGELVASGAVAVSDDGEPIMDSSIMRLALEYAGMFNIPVISHCEDKYLSGEGVMNEGYVSTVLGLPGIPASSEEIMVARDIMLSQLTDSALHIAHISTAGSVELMRVAKSKGIKVSCETAPHYFSLTDEAVKGFNANTRMYPPLRSADDVEAVREGLRDGTIDAIASDHAPHAAFEKEMEYGLAPPGIIGLETALSLSITMLVKKGFLEIGELIARMSARPAEILKLPGGNLRVGSPADITIIDTDRELTVDVGKFASRSRNCPFDGWKLCGEAVMTIVGGGIVVDRCKLSPFTVHSSQLKK